MFAQLGGAINALLGGSKKRSVKKTKNAKRSVKRSQKQMKHRGGNMHEKKKEMMGGNKSRSQRRRGGAIRSQSVFRK